MLNINREMQIKTQWNTISYPLGWLESKSLKLLERMKKQSDSWYTASGNVERYNHLGKQPGSSLNKVLPYDPEKICACKKYVHNCL